ncbi:uncharacterized protein [Dermacentor albipictus]|uniref:uncharacterized protein n=1 Tax=Dermacentor albipictus TaxID=60249 RepID=UPI0038FD01C7
MPQAVGEEQDEDMSSLYRISFYELIVQLKNQRTPNATDTYFLDPGRSTTLVCRRSYRVSTMHWAQMSTREKEKLPLHWQTTLQNLHKSKRGLRQSVDWGL